MEFFYSKSTRNLLEIYSNFTLTISTVPSFLQVFCKFSASFFQQVDMFFDVFVPFSAVFQHLIYSNFASTLHQLFATSQKLNFEQKLKVIAQNTQNTHFSIFFVLKWVFWGIVPCSPCIFTDFLILYIFCTKMGYLGVLGYIYTYGRKIKKI